MIKTTSPNSWLARFARPFFPEGSGRPQPGHGSAYISTWREQDGHLTRRIDRSYMRDGQSKIILLSSCMEQI